MNGPTIFISSTVFDFSDLRSALKDHLEERGCRVLASEFSDFPKGHDRHSYAECLATIEQADIFLLLIGTRRGGWLDEPAGISITRAEFEHAVSLAEQGRIKIVTFVRQEVWDHREGVKELLRSLLKDATVEAERVREIAYHKSKFMDDPKAIIGFIDAVARNHETLAASRGTGKPPIANWIHSFATFTEVRQALDPLIIRGLSVREAAGRKALESQLLVVLQGLLMMGPKGPIFPEQSITRLVKDLDLRPGALGGSVRVGATSWQRLVLLGSFTTRAVADPAPLLPALGSDLLLRYDPASGTYCQTPEYEVLVTLVDQLSRFAKTGTGSLGELIRHGQAIDETGTRRIPVELLSVELHRTLRWAAAVASARSLALSLSGGPLVPPIVLPRSPFREQDDDLAEEEVTLEAARRFVEALRPAPEDGGA